MKQPKGDLLTTGFQRIRLLVIFSILAFLVVSIPIMLHLTARHVTAHISTKVILCGNQPGVRVMPLGDSITYGYGSTAFGGYRVALWNDACSAHLHITFVGSRDSGPVTLPDKANEGFPGWRIDQISAHVVAWLRKYQPQIVLLHIGTNDILQNYHVSAAPARLQYLLTQITITLPHAIVIVAQIIPLAKPGLNNKVVAYNRAIPAIVHNLVTRGKHVEYVDMYHTVPLSDIPGHIHPDDQGYSLMASVWFAALRADLQSHKT